MTKPPPSATLAPPPAIVPTDARPGPQLPWPEQYRYLLAIVMPGVPGLSYVLRGQIHGKPMLTLDRYRAHDWESPAAILEWLRSLPESVLNGLRGRSLFVIKTRVEAIQIVASWHVADAGSGEGAENA